MVAFAELALLTWKALSSFLREDTGGDALPAAALPPMIGPPVT